MDNNNSVVCDNVLKTFKIKYSFVEFWRSTSIKLILKIFSKYVLWISNLEARASRSNLVSFIQYFKCSSFWCSKALTFHPNRGGNLMNAVADTDTISFYLNISCEKQSAWQGERENKSMLGWVWMWRINKFFKTRQCVSSPPFFLSTSGTEV